MNKEFKKYMSAYNIWWKIGTGIGAAYFIALLCGLILGNDIKYIGFLIFGGIILLTLIPLWFDKKFEDKLKKDGLTEQVQADFEKSLVMMNNRIRFGEKWIFMKNKHILLEYEDVRQIYQYILKKNFVESERALKYVNAKGKHRKLCNLKRGGKSDEDVKKIIGVIYAKNPGLKIGYR